MFVFITTLLKINLEYAIIFKNCRRCTINHCGQYPKKKDFNWIFLKANNSQKLFLKTQNTICAIFANIVLNKIAITVNLDLDILEILDWRP